MKRFCGCFDIALQGFIIHLRHIGETDAKGFKVFSDERGGDKAGNMVSNHHEITRAKIFVHTSCRIG